MVKIQDVVDAADAVFHGARAEHHEAIEVFADRGGQYALVNVTATPDDITQPCHDSKTGHPILDESGAHVHKTHRVQHTKHVYLRLANETPESARAKIERAVELLVGMKAQDIDEAEHAAFDDDDVPHALATPENPASPHDRNVWRVLYRRPL